MGKATIILTDSDDGTDIKIQSKFEPSLEGDVEVAREPTPAQALAIELIETLLKLLVNQSSILKKGLNDGIRSSKIVGSA